MFEETQLTDLFLARLGRAVEAWSALGAAEQIGKSDVGAALDVLRPACLTAGDSYPILARAADILAGWGRPEEALGVIASALGVNGPPAALLLSRARCLAATDDLRGARRWMREALFLQSPSQSTLLELAELDFALGYHDCALRTLQFLDRVECSDPAVEVSRGWFFLNKLHRSDLAEHAFTRAYNMGFRDEDFIISLTWLLTGRMHFANISSMAMDGYVQQRPSMNRTMAMLSAHARLGMYFDREEILQEPRRREASKNWVGLDELAGFLRGKISRGLPFSWIRLGDGEARFLIYAKPALRKILTESEALAIGRVIWENWFGTEITDEDNRQIDGLIDAIDDAVLNCDLLGVTSVYRFFADTAHFGYSAALEKYIEEIVDKCPQKSFTETLFNYDLAKIDPFFSSVIGNLDFIGIVSPHPELADRLKRHFGFSHILSYDIPGEGRLERPREHADRGTHFPAAYHRILSEIQVPFRGAVFLVAGGLLGKVYCDRIKQLGGIALDVGAIVDAWMGFNTRPGHLDETAKATLPF